MSSLLEVTDVSKRFGPTRALDQVCLKAESGRVLALIGENGAGKSTLLKVLSGAHRCDSGWMMLDGKPYSPSGPIDAKNRGVAIVYQELTLAPDLSIEDNLMLGRSGTGLGTLVRGVQRRRVREAMRRVGLGHLSPAARTGDQSIATCQLIEVARALISDAKIILLDEPTSSLPAADVDRLFEIIGQLRERGLAIIYISHFLEEVRRVADDYAVLRDGQSVGEGSLSDISDDQIISLMVGRDVNDLFPHVPHEVGMPRLTLKNVSSSPAPVDVSLRIHEGEIFGVAGLVGAGRTELLRCLYALEPSYQGHVQLEGRSLPHRVGARRREGFGLLSEDRKSEGLAQTLSVTENICMGNHRRFSTLGIVKLGARKAETERLIRQVEVKASSGDQIVSELSGGNQQKVAFARLLAQNADIYLLDEPTKGIDVGTKAEIYRMIGELAASGRTVVFVSSYLPELLSVCDRIGVMSRGRMTEIRKAKDWTEEDLMAAAVG
ncbi:sugar ABC transporter ATP-binding protein [Rhodopirellula sp. MGV]|uniref:sugar ABC transporter ATP-binding protein n=1 Tax=Rhodopirellula sp. MGV TaxID=2023130 RepID=UPI000B978D1B|nr:sugar ABC transporter ATP-binding protein [Rhodopirellula sp. MGV]OYP35777.1 sugar ABC transporter [Rhodopirellula sp. MGV]PNY33641.1 sugar ABC transporter ATP-binding protein [Rhodopirellula baltica]